MNMLNTMLSFLTDLFHFFMDFIMHMDQHLGDIIQEYGALTYVILFCIIFLETGLVVTPFLPGDSILFAAGAFAGLGHLNLAVLFFLLSIAAIIGDTLNYWIGAIIGPKVFHFEKSILFNPEHLKKTHAFYEKYGGKTIVIARFIPIVRTFAPFVAGIGKMSYSHFIIYNVFGAILWISICIFAGYFFGNIPFVKKHFSLVIMGIIVVSILPAVAEFVRHKMQKSKSTDENG